MSAVVYNWMSVRAGDIISFRYKSKDSEHRQLQTILVLNPRIFLPRKGGNREKYFIGIKIEEQNRVELRLTNSRVRRLNKVGKLVLFDEKNKLYRLQIDNRFLVNDIKGLKPKAWEIISQNYEIQGQYRTYLYEKARKSSVKLEPVVIQSNEY